MKKFSIEIIALLFLLLLSANLLYRTDKPLEIQRLENIYTGLEIINLGTSHGFDFVYNDCPLYGMNFNVAANSLYYDLQQYRFLRDKGYLADSAIIMLPVSYFVFGLDENRTDLLPDDSFVDLFYHYLPPKAIYDYSLRKEIKLYTHVVQNNFSSLISKKEKKKAKKKAERKKEDQADEQVGAKNGEAREAKNVQWAEQLEKIAVTRAERHKKLSCFSPEAKNVEYLETLLGEILAAGHRPVLVTTPYYFAYNRNFGEEWLEKNYFPKMHALSVKFNVPYMDYSHDERFTHSPDLFMDSDHLNDEGRPIFSAIIFEDVDKVFDNRKADQ